MPLFRGKYRVSSARLRGWDYSSVGCYFVTVCTRDRQPVLGEVKNEEIHLSHIGQIVWEEWQRTAMVRPYIELDDFVVMPNHIHGIIVIKDAAPETPRVETPQRGVSTPSGLQPKSLGAIIGQFKSISTKRIRKAGFAHFAWQTRYYDHVIRSERSLNVIREYISNNPLKWELEKDNPENLHM